MPQMRCRTCEYGETFPEGATLVCILCGAAMEPGNVLSLKDSQQERDAKASLTAAGYQVGGY